MYYGKVNILVSYNGVWKFEGGKWSYHIHGATGYLISVPKNIKYNQILDKLYEKLSSLDRCLYDLKLRVLFPCEGQPSPPVEISDDEDLSNYIEEITTKDRLVLCVNAAMKKDVYGTAMSCEKASRDIGKGMIIVKGTPGQSYAKLPSYMFMLQKKNLNTLTNITTDADGAFKYCFVSFGASRRGFRFCRPVICLESICLENHYHKQMLTAVGLDAENHLFPLAFAIVDRESNESWSYFMKWLKQAIGGDIFDLVFISSRHANICNAVETIFPHAHHGLSYHYLCLDVRAKYEDDYCPQTLRDAAFAFQESEFMSHFHKIAQRNSAVANYLKEIGFERWSRAYFPGKWYFMVTNNYAKCFESKVQEAQKWPITFLLEYIRSGLQLGNYSRQKHVENCTTTLLPKLQKRLMENLDRAKSLQTCAVDKCEFKVLDARGEMVVNVMTRKCTCRKFQINGIPCEHAVAACLKCGVDIYSLCSMYYKRDYWKQIYVDAIHSPGVEDEWNVPDEIANARVGMPVLSVIADQPLLRKRKSAD